MAVEHDCLVRAILSLVLLPPAAGDIRLRRRMRRLPVSPVPVVPVQVEAVVDCLAESSPRSVEVRSVAELWPLHDAVLASTLQFSMIGMRHARPRSHSTHLSP